MSSGQSREGKILWQPRFGRELQGIALTMAKSYLEASRTIVAACGPPWARRRFRWQGEQRGEEFGVLLLCMVATAIPATVAFYLLF